MMVSRKYCVRHTFSVVSTSSKEKLTPHGRPTGRFGDWQVVQCLHCGHQKQRWAPYSRDPR